MRLDDYLKQKGQTRKAFADEVGVTVNHVFRWIRRDRLARIPNRDNMQKIIDVTDGKVTPNDFYGHSEAA